LGIVLALAASACWGVSDFFGGLQSRRLSALTVVLGVESAGLLIAGAAVLISGKPVPGGEEAAWALAAGLAGVLGLTCFYRALAVGTMSIVAPISSTAVALPVVVGLARGDDLSAPQAVGLACAVAGVLLAGREQGEDAASNAEARRAVLLALAAAVGFGTYFVGSAEAADGGVLWTLLLARAAAVPVLAALAAASRVPLVPDRADTLKLFAIGALDLTATGLYTAATTHGALPVVAVLGALYPVATVLLARALLGERLSSTQGVGVGTALVGVALIARG
jgi:drug/metabolite transporter (DMT)-like permease